MNMRGTLPDPELQSAANDLAWWQYKAQFMDYHRGATRNKVLYRASQGIIITCAALITISAAASVASLIPATLGALITIVGGIQQMCQWERNWIEYRRAAEEMRQHAFAFAARTEPYNGEDSRELLAAHRRSVAITENAGWVQRMQEAVKGA